MAKARDYMGWGFQGKFTPDKVVDFRREFLKPKKTRMVVSVKQFSPKRSNDANSYYHAVVVAFIGEEIEGKDFDHDRIHDTLKAMHNYRVLVSKQGKEVREVLSTVMESDEFWGYVKRVKQWALDFLNVYIPEPGEEVSQLMIDQYRKTA